MSAPMMESREPREPREPRTAGRRVKRRRFPDVGRAKVALPNGLTLGNLFFGINAIIAASRGNFDHAVLYVVLGGVCDAFDGAAARATRTGGRFGEELDSLVDAISFGLAPAMIVHFSVLVNGGTGWNWAVFIFAACAVMRLARFNVTQAGASKTYFQGLPSPAAGGTVATYYWFSQTPFYQNNEAIVGLPWGTVMQWLMIVLGFLMVSDVPYPAWPKVGLRSWKGLLGLAAVMFILFGIGFWRRAFFFPFGVAYVGWGLLRATGLGMWERRPGRDAYTGAPLKRRGTPRSSGAIPAGLEDFDASDLMDPDDLAEEEYDFFDDEDERAAATTARRSASQRTVRGERETRAERADRADRADRLERKRKKRKKERLEQRAAERAAGGAPADPAERPARAERADRPDRPPRPPREPRPERAPVIPPAVTPAASLADGDGEGDEGPDDLEPGTPGGVGTDPERRRRRKRRRGKRPGQGGAPGAGGDGGSDGTAAPSLSFDGGSAAPVPPSFPEPFAGPRPFSRPPEPPAAPPPPPSSPDHREDRSE